MDYKDIIIDSNIWISLFNDKDINHKKSKDIVNNFSYYQVMPDLIFYEVITVLKLKSNLNNALDFVDFVKNNKEITVKLFYENNRDLTWLLYDERFKNLSYTDMLLLYLSRTHTIITFDKDLIKNIKLINGNVFSV